MVLAMAMLMMAIMATTSRRPACRGRWKVSAEANSIRGETVETPRHQKGATKRPGRVQRFVPLICCGPNREGGGMIVSVNTAVGSGQWGLYGLHRTRRQEHNGAKPARSQMNRRPYGRALITSTKKTPITTTLVPFSFFLFFNRQRIWTIHRAVGRSIHLFPFLYFRCRARGLSSRGGLFFWRARSRGAGYIPQRKKTHSLFLHDILRLSLFPFLPSLWTRARRAVAA